jgi:hypothetical protein
VIATIKVGVERERRIFLETCLQAHEPAGGALGRLDAEESGVLDQ